MITGKCFCGEIHYKMYVWIEEAPSWIVFDLSISKFDQSAI